MKKLLVVIDMQNDFIDGVLGSKQAIDIVDNVVNKIDSWEGPILATMDQHMEGTFQKTVEGKRLPMHCEFGGEGWRFNSKVKEAFDRHGSVYICQKPEKFATSEIGSYISTMDIDSVEFVGLCTDICVISNVLMLRSINPYIDISVDSSCCAGINESSHNAALSIMKECCVNIL